MKRRILSDIESWNAKNKRKPLVLKGALTEQYVLQELLAAGASPAYWSSERGDAEVDFLLHGAEAVYPVEGEMKKMITNSTERDS